MSLVGQHIGRYRILEQLGSGGMSVVYKGFDTALDREVAVKVLHPHLAGKEDSRRRLAREARAVAKLQHPNILEVFDFASADSEDAYIVTEYIRGQTLRQYAEKHSFDPPELAAMVIHEVAAALGHAHEVGIIHRDLKPENVMVRQDGVVKLMDFGIAKILDRDDRMTLTGTLVGSPAHMAPEIIEGHEVGPESDVFSLGTMLYYCATAQLPFLGPNATATLKRILDGAYADPRTIVASISDELAAIIAMCLARQPENRYADAGRLHEALASHLVEVGFPRASEELVWFFADPVAYRSQMIDRLIENRLRAAKQYVAEKRSPKSLGCVNQVLALDPTNATAQALLQQMNRARRRRRAQARWLSVLALACGAAACSAGALLIYRQMLKPSSVDIPSASSDPPKRDLTSTAGLTVDAVPEGGGLALRSMDPASGPPARAPAKTARAPRKEAAQGAGPFKFTVKFRPYAYAQIDGEARRPELTQHEFLLRPGTHRLVYGCHFCEEEAKTIEVTENGGPLRVLVQPQPSLLSFQFEPPDSTVTVAGETRTANETQQSPIRISFPKGYPQQRVEYEIAHRGFRTRRDAINLAAGESRTIQGSLVHE